VNVLAIENTLSTGTAGGWGAAEAINAEYDPMKANTDYALVGYLTDTLAAGIAWRGADTSNYRVGGPGHKDNRMQTRDWFVRLSEFLSAAAHSGVQQQQPRRDSDRLRGRRERRGSAREQHLRRARAAIRRG
jgi:hypothetical protein